MSESSSLAQDLLRLTNFERDCLLNETAGNTNQDSWDSVESQLKFIESEFAELKKALAERDRTGVRDGIADVLVTVHGLAFRLNIDADADHYAVALSNFSKFDETQDSALATKKKYEALNVETFVRTTKVSNDKVLYVTVSAKDQVGNDGKSYPKGKFLKSVHFQEPSFT